MRASGVGNAAETLKAVADDRAGRVKAALCKVGDCRCTEAITRFVTEENSCSGRLCNRSLGAWTLTEGAEQMPDGRKNLPWAIGGLTLEPSGHFAFFVFGKNRREADGPPEPRVPAGPMVAYYGTFTADDAAKTLTYHVDTASTPIFNGITPTQHVTLDGGKLVTTGSLVKTPQGNINLINS